MFGINIENARKAHLNKLRANDVIAQTEKNEREIKPGNFH